MDSHMSKTSYFELHNILKIIYLSHIHMQSHFKTLRQQEEKIN
jgi:hypothetical protein